MPEYDITHNRFSDIYGRLLWVEPFDNEHRLYRVGETVPRDYVSYLVERVALAENTQHINVSVIEEDIIITEPHL